MGFLNWATGKWQKVHFFTVNIVLIFIFTTNPLLKKYVCVASPWREEISTVFSCGEQTEKLVISSN